MAEGGAARRVRGGGGRRRKRRRAADGGEAGRRRRGLGFFSSVCLEKEADDGGDGDSCRPWPLASAALRLGFRVDDSSCHVCEYTASIRVIV